jgi:hypothetical protein
VQLANLGLVRSGSVNYIHEYYTFEIPSLPSKSFRIYQLGLNHLKTGKN